MKLRQLSVGAASGPHVLQAERGRRLHPVADLTLHKLCLVKTGKLGVCIQRGATGAVGIPACTEPALLQVSSSAWEDLKGLITTFLCISGICCFFKVIAEPHHIQLPLSQAVGG